MEFDNMLAAGERGGADMADRRQSHQYPARHIGNGQDMYGNGYAYGVNMHRPARTSNGSAGGSGSHRASPMKKDQKHVVFQLIDPEDPRIQARLPMRVMISSHDSTDSIITTVKNFYGLYDYGVSFENKDGISIIAAYDNFENDMVVYVRTVAQPPGAASERAHTMSPRKPTLGAPIEMRAPQVGSAHSPSRSVRQGMRSMSPQSEYGRRSVSAAPGKGRKSKSKENSVMGDGDGYSSDEGANASVTSSRRSKTEQVNAEISVDNIVEGGRRKRAFESSELPLFVPPQVPITASISSISPQRRSGPGQAASPYAYPNQQTFSYTQPLPSPQSHGSGHYMQSAMPPNPYGAYAQPPRQLRGARPVSTTYPPARLSGNGILPTPDPTVGSVISDEDVALQLMRLGDASNFSHGRTSTSTLDDALSGKAEAPSSDEEDEDEEEVDNSLPAVPTWPKNDVGPQRKKQRTMNGPASDGTSGDEYEDHRDGSFKGESDEITPNKDGQRRGSKTKMGKPRPNSFIPGALKVSKQRSGSMAKPKTKPLGHGHTNSHSHSHSHSQAKIPMSPASLPPQSRKTSAASTVNFQHALRADEEDLSTKPRCQRCRKSKKGCDRQRPCGRCKDAGIGIEGCVSEDEGNGRKGRYGRHMGVPVKKGEEGFRSAPSVEPMPQPSMSASAGGQGIPNGGYFLAPAPIDKSKKRKR